MRLCRRAGRCAAASRAKERHRGACAAARGGKPPGGGRGKRSACGEHGGAQRLAHARETVDGKGAAAYMSESLYGGIS